MSWLTSMFTSDTISKSVDAVIATGDKLWYTDEEKAEGKIKTSEMHIKMLDAYAPFKVAQRLLALTVTIPFVVIHIGAAIMVGFGLDTAKDIMIMNNDTLGLPVLAVLSFYFGGGVIDSYKRKQNNDR